MSRTIEQLEASVSYHGAEERSARSQARIARSEGDTQWASELEDVAMLHNKWGAEDEDELTDRQLQVAGL